MVELEFALKQNIDEAVGILKEIDGHRINFDEMEGDNPWVLIEDFDDNLQKAIVQECSLDEQDSIDLIVTTDNSTEIPYYLADCACLTAHNVCRSIQEFYIQCEDY